MDRGQCWRWRSIGLGWVHHLFVAILVIFPAHAQLTGPVTLSDGDTFKMSHQRIRLSGIDTPERAQWCLHAGSQCYPCGKLATEHGRSLTEGEMVTCWPTGDKTYGRIVASCFVGGKDYQISMISAGWALAYRRFLSGEMKARYVAVENAAKSAKRGLWVGSFVYPWDWRNRKARVGSCPDGVP